MTNRGLGETKSLAYPDCLLVSRLDQIYKIRRVVRVKGERKEHDGKVIHGRAAPVHILGHHILEWGRCASQNRARSLNHFGNGLTISQATK